MDAELLQAVITGNMPRFRWLADQNPSLLLSTTPQSNTILHIAAKHGHLEIMREVLQRKASLLMKPNLKGDSALHVAARAGHSLAVNFLLEWADRWSVLFAVEEGRRDGFVAEVVAMKNKDNYTAMHEAVRRGWTEVMTSLTAAVKEAESAEGDDSKSPLYLAAEIGHVGVVRQLLLSPYCSSLGGPGGRTALHAAVLQGHCDVAMELIRNSPKLIKQGDASGTSPLHCAASLGNLKMTKLLLESDTSAAYDVDNLGRSPIHMAAINGYVSIVQEIIHYSPDSVELLDARSCNILHLAVIRNKASVVKYIVKDPRLDELLNEKDIDGNSPLHIAVINQNPYAVSLLCSHEGVDTGIVNKNGRTALDIAELVDKPSIRTRKHTILEALKRRRARRANHGDDILENDLPVAPLDHALIDHYKGRANTLALVATLIASVTFAAAFSLPGGYKNAEPNEGSAVLLGKDALKVFLVADTIAMCTSITTAFSLIWAALGDHDIFVLTVEISTGLMWISLYSMAIAFATGVHAVASESEWLISVIYILCCSIPYIASLVPFIGLNLPRWFGTWSTKIGWFGNIF